MKRFLDKLLNWFEAMGRARAAAELSRQGRYKEAQALILENNS